MSKILYGPNQGREFPHINSVEGFEYNGFCVNPRKGFSKWLIEDFLGWTNDPGVGSFKCNDGEVRLIPTCQLSEEYYKTLPEAPKLEPFKGIGVFFGAPSSSDPNVY